MLSAKESTGVWGAILLERKIKQKEEQEAAEQER
jgi:hypothetical protein